MRSHVDSITDISDRPWCAGTAADYRAEVKRLAPRVLAWHGGTERTRFGYAQRHEAAEALGYPSSHAQLAGDAYYHLRDQGYAAVEKKGRSATAWYWSLTDKGLDATADVYLNGDGS